MGNIFNNLSEQEKKHVESGLIVGSCIIIGFIGLSMVIIYKIIVK